MKYVFSEQNNPSIHSIKCFINYFSNSYLILSGRNWKGTAFGGWKARTEVPKLVQTVMRGEMALEPYITHTYQVQNKAMD